RRHLFAEVDGGAAPDVVAASFGYQTLASAGAPRSGVVALHAAEDEHGVAVDERHLEARIGALEARPQLDIVPIDADTHAALDLDVAAPVGLQSPAFGNAQRPKQGVAV